jgi:VAD1 Analog of StAR-related lipid transfer domain
VTIGTEIEYRVGGYFVLAVNINTIDWARLIKTNNRDLKARKAKWRKDSSNKQHDDASDEHAKSQLSGLITFLMAMYRRVVSLSKYDFIDHMLAWMFYLHWIVYLPICKLAYKTPGIGSTIRKFIIVSAIDEICYYVHERGMEMEIRVLKADHQASFMLSALREIRADGRELKKKRQETEAQEAGMILGPLLGPRIKEDDGPAIEPPGFELPVNLDFVGLEVDLPVGFRRLRWAYLSRKSTFITDALWKAESKYENITISDWSKHSDVIGDPHPPPTVNIDDFIGAEFEASYLMPKSAFVSANMSYATSQLIAYNDYCFCVKTRSRNPDAPFGSTFVAWTQVMVINLGNNCCKLICSVEAEFPNGPPMVRPMLDSGFEYSSLTDANFSWTGCSSNTKWDASRHRGIVRFDGGNNFKVRQCCSVN